MEPSSLPGSIGLGTCCRMRPTAARLGAVLVGWPQRGEAKVRRNLLALVLIGAAMLGVVGCGGGEAATSTTTEATTTTVVVQPGTWVATSPEPFGQLRLTVNADSTAISDIKWDADSGWFCGAVDSADLANVFAVAASGLGTPEAEYAALITEGAFQGLLLVNTQDSQTTGDLYSLSLTGAFTSSSEASGTWEWNPGGAGVCSGTWSAQPE